MRQKTRSAAALVTTSLLAGGGIAAAVTGFGHPAPTPVTSTVAASASRDAALSTAVKELLDRSQALHGRLSATRHELMVLDRRLHQQRLLAKQLASAPVAVPPQYVSGATPPVHTTTRASSGAAAPGVHTTTRASGSAPGVHTTTRASAAGGGEPGESGGDD